MIQFHDDEEGETKAEDRGLGWWMFLPVVAMGILVYEISTASMSSIFDENE